MIPFRFLLILIWANLASGQYIEETIPEIYYSDSDTITYKYSNYPKTLSLDLAKRDTLSPGTNTAKGIVLTAFIGRDTLQIKGDNHPFAKRSHVRIQTPNRTTVVIFRFNAVASNFSQEYINANRGKTTIALPEVYELANIIWTLSPVGQNATDLQKDSRYFREVQRYFQPHLEHPVFKQLAANAKNHDRYLEFRENSFMYDFDGDRIVKGSNYNYVFGDDWQGFTNLFTNLLPVVQDFASQSNFREFFKKHQAYYAREVGRMDDLLPIASMWQWLEREFPIKQDAYKIVFSPLTGGSHSTQKYFGKDLEKETWFSECVMFICGPNRYDSVKRLTQQQRAGLLSGVVFTEIDHNYVNPISDKYRDEIAKTFQSDIWSGPDNEHYATPLSIFNEYMTHAVFCLWAMDHYDAKTADYIVKERVKLNSKSRGFLKFAEFNAQLAKLRKGSPAKTIAGLYPDILEWAKLQN